MVALSGGISLGAHAQTGPATAGPVATGQELGTVVVTAERRKSSVQKTALTINVVSGANITKHGDTEMSQIIQDVPGVQVQGTDDTGATSGVGGSGGPPLIAIRGLGTDGPNKSPATAVYLDGVILQNSGADYYDIDRVEVVSGPQGTLYGRNATGGAVNIITNDPSHKYEAIGQVQYGSDAFVGGQAIVNVPYGDQIAVRLGINGDRHNGYLPGDTGSVKEYNMRGKLLYQPNDNIRALLGVELFHADNSLAAGSYAVTPANPEPHNFDVTSSIDGFDNDIFEKYYAQFDVNLGLANLTYIPAFQTTHSTSGNTEVFGPGVTFYQDTVSPFNKTTTQEVRISNPDGSKLTWVAGAYYYHTDFEQLYYIQPPGVPAPFLAFPQHPIENSIAGFGEATYPITDTIRVTGGAREDSDSVRTIMGCNPGSPPGCMQIFDSRTSKYGYTAGQHFDWKARLEGDLTPVNMVYAMVSTGYRVGGFANGGAYRPETVTSYEIGTKNRFDNITLNAAAFYYDYSGFQVLQSETENSQPVSDVVNMPAREYGLDVEASAYLTPNDKVTLLPEFIHGAFSGNGTYACPAGVCGEGLIDYPILANGKQMPHISEFSLSGSYSHDFNLANGATITPDADFHYQSKQITDFDISNYAGTPFSASSLPNPEFEQTGYGLFNASIIYTSADGYYSVDVYGKNLSNTVYKLTDNNTPPAGVGASLGDPRTIGVILRVHL